MKLSLAVLLLLTPAAQAQTISGQVLDSGGAGVAGILATLRIDNRTWEPKWTRSDQKGGFKWDGLSPGKYYVQLSDRRYLFTPGERSVELTAKGKPSLKFWTVPLPAEAVTPPPSQINADFITLQWLPLPGATTGENVMLAGIRVAYADKDFLRVEWKDGRTPGVFPLWGLKYWGFVPEPPQ